MKIGDLAKAANVSVDTLRYYEKIGLIKDVKRRSSGYRIYDQVNVAQVQFIRNAQHSRFSLEEISHLLDFRDAPVEAKPRVRRLAEEKVTELTDQINILNSLRDKLKLLVEQCNSESRYCPIIDKFSDNST